MNRTWSKTVVIVIWSVPVALPGVMAVANAGLAGAYARLLERAGMTPGTGLAALGYWAALFGALAVTNLPALAVFGGWVRAVGREQAARAEIRAAMRWPAIVARRQPHLWPGMPVSAPRASIRRTLARRLGWHVPYVTLFGLSLAAPVALASLLAAG